MTKTIAMIPEELRWKTIISHKKRGWGWVIGIKQLQVSASQQDAIDILSGAASDAGRQVFIQKRLFQSNDHTVSLHFPEGEYLKGFICKVI